MESSLYNPRLEPAGAPPAPPQQERRPPWRRILGWLGAGALLAFKFAAKLKGLLLLLPKLKILTTSGTMLVSVAAYALIWGWRFALGFVLLLFVHEMGHVIQLRREGIPASAPMFIPFLGAVVAMKELPKDAAAEARVGLAGPVLGLRGSARAARDLRGRRERAVPRPRLRGLPAEPVQPAPRAPARRRTRHGRPLPLAVVRGIRAPRSRPRSCSRTRC